MASKIWVVLQQRDGVLHRMSLETVAAGQELARRTGGEVEAILLGAGLGELAAELAGKWQMAAFHVGDAPALATYTPGAYVAALAAAVRQVGPRWVLFPHTYQSMDYFPRLAPAVEASLVPGAGSFEVDGQEVIWNRPVLGGKLHSRVRVKQDGPVLVSLQSGAFAADQVTAGTAPVQSLVLPEIEPDREILAVEQAGEEEVDLSRASVIVAAGRGVGSADKMQVIHDLAAALGAEIGASRPVIDNGWLSRDRQIGSSGQTVAPRLYIAAGVSGAIQHLVGMKGSGCVVAINKDANAPIFSVADYGIVGDLHEVLPPLTAAIREAKGS